MHFTKQVIADLENRYRAHLINSLSGFKSANLVGTQDSNGQTNLAIVSSVFHLGAHPPLVGMIIRPHSVPRHTLENLLATKQYTINHVNKDIYNKAHQTSARYDKGESEFDATGLSTEYLNDFTAPFVKESKLKYALELKEHHYLAINGTELIIGEITDIYLDEACLQEDGFIDIEAIGTVAVSGLDSYHVTERLARLAYAKK
ncbi:flavin reductase [Pseudoalteromonas sp. Cn5-37]|uniref:flavin reductase family protein n=1 Tax=Pseudoalteromonas sp. Cn5-37 TaxID=2908886 RepID=UPI001F210122|nr:flavin reductase [Pseudoalteromonas sp. Cn5-37]MCF2916327.1 flavin reductase [Pseudoalteromonas sp. Cn5-37]